ncbi:MAG: hypothetical protein Q9157_004674 [Trypethelium eluteriae]
MSRSTTFKSPARQPLVHHSQAQLKPDHVQGPVSFFNPTRARFDLPSLQAPPINAPSSSYAGGTPPPVGDAQLEWRSRDNRKGRHVLIVPSTHKKTDSPQLTTTWSGIAQGIWRMFTVMAWWDVSWWIAVLFTWGSAIFVVCGFFYWLPLAAPNTEFPNESSIAGGVTAFLGATLFTIGGVLLIVEASNENQTGCFGWALEHAFSHTNESDSEAISPNKDAPRLRPAECSHHHGQGVHRSDVLHLQHPSAGRNWEWWPTWHELKTHYFHEIGWWASSIMAVGAVIFYVSGIMALPGIYNKISTPVLDGTYWLAYLVGGILFVISSVFYVLETQSAWYIPAPKLIGWWIGVLNLIGSVGWTLSASFGYCSASWCVYQSNLSLLWASWAFLFGSGLLWYEALDKYPVERA